MRKKQKLLGWTKKVYCHLDKVYYNLDKVYYHVDKLFFHVDKVYYHMDKVYCQVDKVYFHVDKVYCHVDLRLHDPQQLETLDQTEIQACQTDGRLSYVKTNSFTTLLLKMLK